MAIESPRLNETRRGVGRHLRGVAIATLSFVAGLLMALLALLMVGRAAQSRPGSLLGSWFQRTTHTDLSQPTVVDRIQRLQRLESVVYTHATSTSASARNKTRQRE